MRALYVIALVAACGDDGSDPDSCRPGGFAEGDGEVAMESLGPWVRAAQVPVGAMTALVFDEVDGTCGEVATTGKHLVLLMCEPPDEKNYRIVQRQQFRCPGNEVFAVVERDGGTDVASSLDGILRIDSAGGCVTGGYTVQLDTFDDLGGVFDAVVCD
jgi:hypothetical protein